jgi:hypothetical protein
MYSPTSASSPPPLPPPKPRTFSQKFAAGLLGACTLIWKGITWKNAKISAVLAALLITIGIFIWYFSHLVFTKSRQAVEGSFEYDFFVKEIVKDTPLFKPLEGSGNYFYHVVVSESIPINTVTYRSKAPVDEIVSYYRLYYQILNFTFIKHQFDSDAMAIFQTTRERINLFVQDQGELRQVSIEYLRVDSHS